jgi:hypothetical protein
MQLVSAKIPEVWQRGGKSSRQEAGFGPVATGMEAAVSGVEVGLDRHKEERAYDADAEVEVSQRCADIARESNGLMKLV